MRFPSTILIHVVARWSSAVAVSSRLLTIRSSFPQKAREAERKRFPAIDKIGSDISSSEDELLTGEEPRRSPTAAPPAQVDKMADNLDDDQVSNVLEGF